MSVPERIGKFSITGVLGTGAMGVVYKGFDPVIRRPLAVKTVRRDLIEGDERAEWVAARFRHEAQAGGRLAHPGIVGVYEYGEDANLAYIAMEYVEGQSLRTYFGRGASFAEADAVSVMAQLLDALHHAHELGVVHRDVKPANIIITAGGRVKVADFGVAHLSATTLTRPGALMGTPGYMAPEQYRGEPVDRRVDVFASGVVFYQLLTGRAPFTAGSEGAMMHKVCYEDPAPVSKVADLGSAAAYDTIVTRALAKDPHRRFGTTLDFRAAIAAAHEKPVSATVSDETIANWPTVASDGGASGRQGGNGTATEPLGPPPTGWDADVLGEIERDLARFVGPMARVMVQRAARQAPDARALKEMLASQLVSDRDRAAFLGAGPRPARAGAATRPPLETSTKSTRAPSASGAAVSSALAEQATRVLAGFIGPIAGVAVRRATAQAADREQFFQALAEHVVRTDDRARLLNALARLS